MCTGLEIAALAGATATSAGLVMNYETNRRTRNTARDAVKAGELADTRATQDANSRLAMRKRALSANSLATGGGESMGMAGGRSTLGGG